MKVLLLLNFLMIAQSVSILALIPSRIPKKILNLTEFMDLMWDKVRIKKCLFSLFFSIVLLYLKWLYTCLLLSKKCHWKKGTSSANTSMYIPVWCALLACCLSNALMFNLHCAAELFTDVQPFVQSALDGYNVSIFAYGQTCSGKTHTMVSPLPPYLCVDANYMRGLSILFMLIKVWNNACFFID